MVELLNKNNVLYSLLKPLWEGKHILLIITILFFLCSIIYSQASPKVWRSEAIISKSDENINFYHTIERVNLYLKSKTLLNISKEKTFNDYINAFNNEFYKNEFYKDEGLSKKGIGFDNFSSSIKANRLDKTLNDKYVLSFKSNNPELSFNILEKYINFIELNDIKVEVKNEISTFIKLENINNIKSEALHELKSVSLLNTKPYNTFEYVKKPSVPNKTITPSENLIVLVFTLLGFILSLSFILFVDSRKNGLVE